ncbi:MAG: tRNA pseudouridine(55) synthase TruB [Sphingomonadaceae bacterium]|nr:tRNA pseudouridine(55) synthase TruB [Sphingomonadaceae bacterium]
MDGWIILDKPVGLGSTQAVGAVKRALREADWPKRKVGHGGTLDPLASGVLPIAIGEATKLSGRMLDADKVYAFTIRFGEETDTLDLEGVVIATSRVRPSLAALEAVLPRFTGPIEQIPPAYSALKVDGQRAYDRARAGEEVLLASRRVTVHALTVIPAQAESHSAAGAGGALDSGLRRDDEDEYAEVSLLVTVSKGTYIRSLARDIARLLGTVGHITMLRRLKAGPFTLASAISLDKLTEFAKAHALEKAILPLTAGLDDIPALPVTPDQARLLRQGRQVIGIAAAPGLHLALEGINPVALVESEGTSLRVVRGFNVD